MPEQQGSNPNQQARPSSTYSYPDQLRIATQQLHSMVKMLSEISGSLPTLRRVFRGEVLYQDESGNSQWIQIVKPMFVQTDPTTEKPLRQIITLPDKSTKQGFLPNDEAIEEILSMLYFLGLNPVTPLTNLDENIILDDLKEFECKLAATLTLKQKEWGMDKILLPIIQTKIKTAVQDVRYMAKNGTVLKALQTTVSRVEQVLEGERFRTKNKVSPYQ